MNLILNKQKRRYRSRYKPINLARIQAHVEECDKRAHKNKPNTLTTKPHVISHPAQSNIEPSQLSSPYRRLPFAFELLC